MLHHNRSHSGQANRHPLQVLKVAKIVGIIIIVISVISVFCFGFYQLFWKWLVIKNLNCFLANQQISSQECQAATGLYGKSLLFSKLDDQNSLQQIQQISVSDQLIYFTHLRKRLPATVELYFNVSQPKYLVTEDQKEWYVVNEQGKVKQISQKISVPVCFFSQAWSQKAVWTDNMALKEHSLILNWLESANDAGSEVTYIGFDDLNQISILFQNGRRILVAAKSVPQVELARLKLIEQEIKNNERTSEAKISEIDLRFKFPVIRFVGK